MTRRRPERPRNCHLHVSMRQRDASATMEPVMDSVDAPEPTDDDLLAALRAAAGEVPEAVREAVHNLGWLAGAPADPERQIV